VHRKPSAGEARLKKDGIRLLSKKLKLPTSNKPSFACLASRFAYGEPITEIGLKLVVDRAKVFLCELGFSQVRVWFLGPLARIEVTREEVAGLLDPTMRNRISHKLREIGFTYVALDLEGSRSGSMNETLSKGEDLEVE
jgi:uncharacterized protein